MIAHWWGWGAVYRRCGCSRPLWKPSRGREERNVTTGYDNKIPTSEKYLSTYFSKWSPFRKLQEINLEAAGVKRCYVESRHGRKLKSGAVAGPSKSNRSQDPVNSNCSKMPRLHFGSQDLQRQPNVGAWWSPQERSKQALSYLWMILLETSTDGSAMPWNVCSRFYSDRISKSHEVAS